MLLTCTLVIFSLGTHAVIKSLILIRCYLSVGLLCNTLGLLPFEGHWCVHFLTCGVFRLTAVCVNAQAQWEGYPYGLVHSLWHISEQRWIILVMYTDLCLWKIVPHWQLSLFRLLVCLPLHMVADVSQEFDFQESDDIDKLVLISFLVVKDLCFFLFCNPDCFGPFILKAGLQWLD